MIAISVQSCSITYFYHLGTMDSIVTFYQNPLNFVLFFALGNLVHKYQVFDKKIPLLSFLIALCVLLIIVYVTIILSLKVNYINPLTILFEFVAIFLLLPLANVSKGFFIVDLGKYTYIMYFVHMQVGIAFSNKIMSLCHISSDWFLFFLQPICVLLITYSLVKLMRLMSYAMHLNKLNKICGLPS